MGDLRAVGSARPAVLSVGTACRRSAADEAQAGQTRQEFPALQGRVHARHARDRENGLGRGIRSFHDDALRLHQRNPGLSVCDWATPNTFKRWNKGRTSYRIIFKYKNSGWQFTPTSDTALACHKMSFRDLLLAIALFINTPNPAHDTAIAITTRPEAGEDGEKFILPPKADLRRLLRAAQSHDNTGHADAVVRDFMFVGLRASELRGLPLRTLSLDLSQPKLRVDQRADEKDEIGPAKTKMSRRDIVLGPETVTALKQWLEARPASEFVFPNEAGNVWSYQNLWNRFWVPLMNRAGLVTDEPASATVRTWSKEQANFKQPRFGLHMLRHVYASLQIEQGVQPKRLQALMGRATLKLTMDTYGHLWPNEDEDQRAAKVEIVLG